MITLLRNSAVAVSIAATSFSIAPQTAQAQTYPIDCAILLCLSGGFPPSVPCGLARAEFIRRITPWPIEPPLQIWRCPLGASYNGSTTATDRFYEIMMNDEPINFSYPSEPLTDLPLGLQPAVVKTTGGPTLRPTERDLLLLAQDQADIDISDPIYDFVRSIRVFDINIDDDRDSQSDGGSCNRYARIIVGSYGEQGDFSWGSPTPDRSQIPAAFGPTESGCSLRARAVFMEWRDYEGTYDSERVDY